MKSNITFAVLAYNEEKRLPFVIKNLRKYGEIIILDGGSTDKTKEIAESLGARWYARPENKKPYVESKENYDFLKSLVTTEYIYWGYSDNIVPKKTLEALTEVAAEKKYKWVNAPLYTYLWGNTENYIQKSYIPVLHHRDYINFDNERIHSMGDFTGETSEIMNLPDTLAYAVNHFSVYDMRKFVMGHLRYAEVEAEQKFTRGEKFSAIKMFAAMIRYMWIYGKNGYKNGLFGIIVMMFYAFFRLMAYTKLYELENNITIDEVEKKYNVLKEKMMKDFE